MTFSVKRSIVWFQHECGVVICHVSAEGHVVYTQQPSVSDAVGATPFIASYTQPLSNDLFSVPTTDDELSQVRLWLLFAIFRAAFDPVPAPAA